MGFRDIHNGKTKRMGYDGVFHNHLRTRGIFYKQEGKKMTLYQYSKLRGRNYRVVRRIAQTHGVGTNREPGPFGNQVNLTVEEIEILDATQRKVKEW